MFPVHTSGWSVSFTEDLSEFRQIYLKIQALVGKVMIESVLLSLGRNIELLIRPNFLTTLLTLFRVVEKFHSSD